MLKVSVIIPTYRTPTDVLEQCLVSAAEQTLAPMEIIVVDDNDDYREQKLVKKTLKSVQKRRNLPNAKKLRLISRGYNQGLVLARRTGIIEASGTYITFLDSDDRFTTPDAMQTAYDKAQGVDILQFCAKPVKLSPYIREDSGDAYRLVEHPRQGNFTADTHELFAEEYLTTSQYCLFLWGKLFLRETIVNAIQEMPLMNCFMAEDLLFSYYIARKSLRYRGIPDVLYQYNLGQGISTNAATIDSLDRWEKLCTPASVFTAIMSDLCQNPMPDDKLAKHFNKVLTHFAVRNYKSLERVEPSQREKAYAILEEYWGPEILEQVKQHCMTEQTQPRPDFS